VRRIALAVVALSLVATAALAGQARNVLLEPGALKTFSGRIDVVNRGQGMEMMLATDSEDHWFRVETESLTPLPKSFSASHAEVFYWPGHLLVMIPDEKRALHFTVRDFRPARPSPWVKDNLGPVRDAAALDALLAGYEVTRVTSAIMIGSSQGPRGGLEALSLERAGEGRIAGDKVFYQPTDTGNGGVNCGASCEIRCNDGSSCSTSCVSPRCAKCSCPTSCSCGF
jgi:hypothetical protein